MALAFLLAGITPERCHSIRAPVIIADGMLLRNTQFV